MPREMVSVSGSHHCFGPSETRVVDVTQHISCVFIWCPYHCYETWNRRQTWHTHIQVSPLGRCCLWLDDSKIQYVPHLKNSNLVLYFQAILVGCWYIGSETDESLGIKWKLYIYPGLSGKLHLSPFLPLRWHLAFLPKPPHPCRTPHLFNQTLCITTLVFVMLQSRLDILSAAMNAHQFLFFI